MEFSLVLVLHNNLKFEGYKHEGRVVEADGNTSVVA
jgi:hypothetical protein